MRGQHVNVGVVDAVLRLIGGVFFATCDIAGGRARGRGTKSK
jgi:hypothetical protein